METGREAGPDPDRPPIGVAARDRDFAEACAAVVERTGGRSLPMAPGDELPAGIGGLVVGSDSESDEDFAMSAIQAALAADMPVLCVGPGMQGLNLAMGGKPARRISGHSSVAQDGERQSSYHRIYIAPGSKLAAVVGSGGFVRVNSRHSLGVREADKSPRLLASAYSLDDGLIEALESPDHRWAIGVQFHPERRSELPPHFERLFQSLVDRAREYLEGSIGIVSR